jgi:O-antigen/teichoic acid export membrane protein
VTPDPIENRPLQPPGPGSTAATERQSSAWDIRHGPRNYASLVATQVAAAVLSFAAVWLISRYLGSEGYGAIVAVIAASQVAQVLVNWTSTALVRYGIDEYIETQKIARIFWTRFSIVAVNSAAALLSAVFWFPVLSDWLKLTPGTFWLVITHFILTVLWIHVQFSLQGVKMLRFQGILLMVEKATSFLCVLVLASFGKLDFFSAAICYLIAPTVAMIAGIFQLRSYIFARFTVEPSFYKRIILYSAPLLPLSLVGYFTGSYVDAVFISKLLSIKDLGIYYVGTQITGIALQFPTLINNLLLPFFITLRKEEQEKKSRRYFKHALPVMVLFWGVGCSVVSVCGYYAVPVIFGGDFVQTVLPLWILLAGSTLIVPVLAGYGAYSTAHSTTYISLVAGVFAAIANIGLNILLIPRWGLAGCALATAGTYFISALVHAIMLRSVLSLTIAWTFLAMTPSIGGAIGFFLMGSPWQAFAICAAASGIIVFLKRHSLSEAFALVNTFRFRNS